MRNETPEQFRERMRKKAAEAARFRRLDEEAAVATVRAGGRPPRNTRPIELPKRTKTEHVPQKR